MIEKRAVAILVNADGSTEKKEYRAEYRIVDYERGRVWAAGGVAHDGETVSHVYAQIPWVSFSNRTPREELEAQIQYRRERK